MRRPLTEKQLVQVNPDIIYNVKKYVLNIKLWKNITAATKKHLNSVTYKKFPFNGNIQRHLSKSAKGIYFFTVEPDFQFPPTIVHLLYIGKVEKTDTFHHRFYDYVGAIGLKDKRRNIQLLTNLWPGKTWVYVFELALPDADIVTIEDNLLDSIVPPLNNRFKLKQAKNSRSIYN